MSLFRRASDPTARELFLVTALAAVGISADDIKAAQDANESGFLKSITESDTAAFKSAADAAAKAKADHQALTTLLANAGFAADDIASAEAFNNAIKARVAKDLVELSSSRGIKPVVQAPASAPKEKLKMTRSEFLALNHADRMKFAVSGGRLTD